MIRRIKQCNQYPKNASSVAQTHPKSINPLGGLGQSNHGGKAFPSPGSQDFRIPSQGCGVLLPIDTERASALNICFHKSIKNVAIPISFTDQPSALLFASSRARPYTGTRENGDEVPAERTSNTCFRGSVDSFQVPTRCLCLSRIRRYRS